LLLATTIHIYLGTSQVRAAAMLFAKSDGGWWVAWDGGREKALYELGHSTVIFGEQGMSGLTVEGSSWKLTGDPKRDVFHESNTGPHRWFEQTWALDGDAYVLQGQQVIPSGYNTLVEFVYALKVGDDARAASLTLDEALVQTAKDLGLVQSSAERWSGWCDGQPRSYIEPPCIIELPSGDHVRVSMVPDGDSWLLSGIEPDEPIS
jgi:hypothetical protein